MFSTPSSNACCECQRVTINAMCSKQSAVPLVASVSVRDPASVQPPTVVYCLDIHFTDLPFWTSTTNLMQGRAEETTVRYKWTNMHIMHVCTKQ